MGPLRSMSVEGARRLLRWRERPGRGAVVGHLDGLAVALASKGYRHIKLYQAAELPGRPLLLWVFVFGVEGHVRVAVTVRAMDGGAWAYYEAGHGEEKFLGPCGDAQYAAERVDALLKHRMFPSTW